MSTVLTLELSVLPAGLLAQVESLLTPLLAHFSADVAGFNGEALVQTILAAAATGGNIVAIASAIAANLSTIFPSANSAELVAGQLFLKWAGTALSVIL